MCAMNICESNADQVGSNSTLSECDTHLNEFLVIECQPKLIDMICDNNINANLDQIFNFDINTVISTVKTLIQDVYENNITVHHNCLLIVKSLLTLQSSNKRKEMTLMIINDNEMIAYLIHIGEHVLYNENNEEVIIETFFHIINKLSIHKKFVQKVYTNHKLWLTKSLSLMQYYRHKYKILSLILCYLKHFLKNPLCAQILCTKNIDQLLEDNISAENELIKIIYEILSDQKWMSSTAIQAIEVLAILCRCHKGITSILKNCSLYIPFLVTLFDNCSSVIIECKSNKNKNIMKCFRFSYNILGIFMHLSYMMNSRDYLIHLSINHKVLTFMKSIIQNKTQIERPEYLNRVFILSSLLIQRLSEPLSLPLKSHYNPYVFELPFNETINYNLQKDNIFNGNDFNSYNNNYDYYCSDESSSDNECDHHLDNESISIENDDKNVISYKQFFPEIKDFGWDLQLKHMDVDNDNIDNNVLTNKRKNSIDSIKSLFCGCFVNNHNSDNITDNINHLNDNTMALNQSIKEMIESSKEDKRKEIFMESADWRHVYTSMALNTKSIQSIVILAEPELAANIGNKELEPLTMDDDYNNYETTRIKLMEHIIQRFEHKNNDLYVIYDIENKDMCFNYKNRLQFESRFESGNLRKVVQNDLTSNEYILLLNTDINTCSHTQWFYFRVSNMKANVEYVFNIINCEKQSSLYNEGQRPVMFSTKEFVVCDKPFWKRVGYSIAYYRNHYLKDNLMTSLMNGKTHYTLTFKIQFPFDNDICYLAFNYPFSYTYLRSCIHFWQNCHNTCNIYFRQQTLCTTLAGNDVPVLTITSCKPIPSSISRQYIVLVGRVHPGESNSSWIIKGCIDFLLSERLSAEKLLEKYVFKIVAMSNPDGVINGNSRTGAQGDDLNRQWSQPNPLLHPTIYHMKSLIKYLNHISNNSNPVVLVDFHGHSRRKNIFVYGCCPSMSWKRSDRNKQHDSSHMALPLLLNSTAPAFSLNNCMFNIEENRERTARITIWRELGLTACYTLECSQAGCDQGLYDGMHLGINQLTEMGSKFCMALLKLQFQYNSITGRLLPVVPNDLLMESNEFLSDKDINEDDNNSEESLLF